MAKNVKVTLQLDNRDYINKINQSERATQSFTNTSTTAVSGLRTAFGALAAAVSVREIIQLGDEFTSLNNRLLAVTDNQQQAASAFNLVKEAAANSRSDLSATADLFAQLTVATNDLNLSQREVADITETFSKTLQISGADAAATAGAMRQFGQALAAGAFRGDEFNSIAEANSFFMLQLADALNQPIGKLRELAADGKLTADVVLEAMRRMKDKVDTTFSETATTVSQSFTNLRNSALELFGAVETETGVFTGLADAINGLAEAIRTLAGFGEQLRLVMVGLVAVLSFFLNPFAKIGAVIGVVSRGFASLIRGGGVLGNVFKQLTTNVKNFGSVVSSRLKGFFGFGENVAKTSPALKNLNNIVDQGTKRLTQIGSAAAGAAIAYNAFKEEVGEDFVGPPAPEVPGGDGGGDDDNILDKKLGPIDKIKKYVEDYVKSLQSIKRGQDEYEKASKDFREGFAKALPDSLQDTNIAFDLLEQGLKGVNDAFDITEPRAERAKSVLELYQEALKNLIPSQSTFEQELKKLQETFGDPQTVAEIQDYETALGALKDAFNINEEVEEFRNLLADITTQEDFNEAMVVLNALLEAGKITLKEYNDLLQQLKNSFEEVEDEALANFLDTLGKAQVALSEDLASAFLEGENAGEAFKDFFKKMVKQIIADIIRLQVIQPILASILSPFGFGFGTGGSIIKLPGRKNGGPVSAGAAYLVGEDGPEILQMGTQGGNIIPNNQLGGQQVTYNINAVDAMSFKQMVARDPEFIFSVTQAGRRRLPI